MNNRHLALYSAEQTRELDGIAINKQGIPGYTLMCRAGEFSFNTLMREFPNAKRIAIVCGVGNNGGDGYVIARLAEQLGIDVDLVQLGDIKGQSDEARLAREAMVQQGVTLKPYSANIFDNTDVIVDAIFGTGLQRPVEDDWATVIDAMNLSRRPILAVDIPSGLHADTGRVLGVAIRAQVTTTFIGNKRGMFTGKGVEQCGRIFFDDLGVPSSVYSSLETSVSRWDTSALKHLQVRERSSHKGKHGHALLIGGDTGYSGAIRLAAEACLRTGAGLTSVATREAHAAIIAQARPELMCHGVEDLDTLHALLDKADVMAIGPGLSQSNWGEAMFNHALELDTRMIMDADALNFLSRAPCQYPQWILTPHPGEAARLLECEVADVENDRFAACEALHRRYGGVCVLKGSGTLIHDGVTTVLCDKGNPGMATGGSGDVLTGILLGLLAQFPKLGLYEIAQLGVGIHALAGDAAAKGGERGMIASDMLGFIRGIINRVATD